MMHKLYQWFLVSVMTVIITACGGGTSSVTDTSVAPTQEITSNTTGISAIQKAAIDYIANYAENGGTPPTIQHYEDAEVSGVNADNIDLINESIAGLTYDQVDTVEELQALADKLGVVLPGTVADEVPPLITLIGSNPQQIIKGTPYTEFGASASDDVDGDISSNIVTDTSAVNTNTEGSYTVTYNVTDAAGNAAVEVTRTVEVTTAPDTTVPVITLLGANPQTLTVGTPYTELGASASDNVDGDISLHIVTDASAVNTNTEGSYTVTYNVTDAAGNAAAQVSRTVNVIAAPFVDITAPDITLLGSTNINLTVGDTYTDAGATASDNIDGDITANIVTANPVDTNTVGIYIVTYNVTDAAGNAAVEVTRTVEVSAAPPPPTSGSTWTFHPSVAQGVQFDAQKGPNNRIHLISSSYYQLDLSGTVLVNESQGDAQQGLLSFPPAIAVGADGSVHLVTRDTGDVKTGVNIRYRRRSSAGSWDRNYVFGTRVARNYVVGISWADTNNIIMSSTDASVDGLYGDIHLWQAGSSSASHLGVSNAIWRADVDSRMRGQNGIVSLVSGNTANTGAAYISKASAGTGILDRLNASMQTHQAGSARRGFPDLAIDIQDNTHFVYGSDSEVYYNKYDANGQKVFASDKRIFTGLGTWHLNTGLSAIAVSESGSVVVIVALRTKGDQEAANTDLLWAYSTDGGVNWSAPQDTGKNSDAGEGRRRPRLVAVGDSFVLLYGDTQASGISMGVITIK